MSECQTCNKPLGLESQDLGFRLCHDCRKCHACSLPITVTEQNYCLEQKLPPSHARCLRSTEDLPAQAQVTLLNLRRLLTESTGLIENMTFEEKYEYLKMLQNTAASVSISINRDKQIRSNKLNSDKWDNDKRKAKQDAETSSRPVNKPNDAEDEKAIAFFMSTYGIKERALALKEMKLRDKAIAALTKAGVGYEAANLTVRQQLEKRFGVHDGSGSVQ